MVVTTPGFVLGERVWIGWFPHTVWADQLPTFLASVAGIVAVGRLARWWGLSAPAVARRRGHRRGRTRRRRYATRVKPYAFDLLGACLVLWLAERVRRQRCARRAVARGRLGGASARSRSRPVPLVVGVWVASAPRRSCGATLSVRLVASGAATASASARCGSRCAAASRRGCARAGTATTSSSARPRASRTRRGRSSTASSPAIGVTTPTLGLHGLGTLDRVALLVLFVVGLAAWRRQLLPLAAVAGRGRALGPVARARSAPGAPTPTSTPRSRWSSPRGRRAAWRLVRRGARTRRRRGPRRARSSFAGLLAAGPGAARAALPGRELRRGRRRRPPRTRSG